MALPSTINPVYHIVQRQYKDNVFIKNKLFNERLAKARNLYRKDLLAHYGCVNAIEFSKDGEYLISGGDDKRILLWSIAGAIYDRGSPIEMRDTHASNIFCLAFDSQNEHIFSGGNDDQVLVHEVYTRKLKLVIAHEKPVYGISIHPENDNILATAGEDGRILLFDIRAPSMNEVQIVIAQQNSGFHSVMFNPANSKLMITANSEEGIGLWDSRKPKTQLIHYDSQSGKISGISACFNSTGTQVLALRRRLPPVLYATESDQAVCQFYHPQYYNSCTMKTCCFAGENDSYVLSGSDDFNLYMWKVPRDECEWGASHLVLRGHRSIVNQVRYNSHNHLIASSGVEKMVKLWSAMPITTWKGSILDDYNVPIRYIYTHEDYVNLVGTTERINHDYSDQSTREDAKMMAFFDSLIQREIEGWNSSTDGSLTTDTDSEEEQNWSKVISRIFRNGSQTVEEPKKYRSNRISQLISRKKNRLAKLAHNKSSSFVRRKCHKEKLKIKKSPKVTPQLPYKNGSIKKSHRKSVEKEHSKRKKENKTKYFTRQSVRNATDHNNSSLDIPSTSTGITSSSGSKRSLYRIIEQDSDEEPRNSNENIEGNNVIEENNFVNILPTPLNGTSDVFINVLEVNNEITARTQRENHHENHTFSSEAEEEEEQSASSYTYTNGNNDANDSDNCDNGLPSDSSDSDFDNSTYITPKRRCLSIASDSGCATGPGSSTSCCSAKRLSRGHHVCSRNRQDSEEEYQSVEKFRKRVRKVRMNIKRKIGADSDSN